MSLRLSSQKTTNTVRKSQHRESILSQRQHEIVNDVTELKENYYCCNLYMYNWHQRKVTWRCRKQQCTSLWHRVCKPTTHIRMCNISQFSLILIYCTSFWHSEFQLYFLPTRRLSTVSFSKFTGIFLASSSNANCEHVIFIWSILVYVS
jgi:hypothetical protein